jgi:heme o synthase
MQHDALLYPQTRPANFALPLALFATTKPRLTALVLATTLAGYALAAKNLSQTVQWSHLLMAMTGVTLCCMGAASLNQLLERHLDAQMRRTRHRPLPAGTITPAQAALFALPVLLLGLTLLLIAASPTSALLSAFAVLIYLLAYTPLKRSSSRALLIGALAGALPPVIGYAALAGPFAFDAWVLFALVYLWQLPHFLAIGWLYRCDYRRAGFPLLTVSDTTGRVTAACLVLSSTLLAAVTLVPAVLGITHRPYLPIALLAALGLILVALTFVQKRTPQRARAVLIASLIYLPVVLTALLLDAA